MVHEKNTNQGAQSPVFLHEKELDMKSFQRVLFTLMLILGMTVTAVAGSEQKVLMVVSGHGQDAGKTRPGYEFEEFAAAYLIFKANGLTIDVASPEGGAVEADKYDPKSTQNAKVLADAVAMSKLENTLAVSGVNASDYDGVFVVGGKGAMFDLPNNQPLQAVIAGVYEQGGTVSAVCHGPAALVNVQLRDGSYLVEGKAVNSFTNVEENLFGQKWMPEFEFMLEDKLKERGANFQDSPLMLRHVAKDGRLITGQNPTSTPAVADEFVRSLGIEPAPREAFGDETTFILIADILDGDEAAEAALIAKPEAYNRPLVGMYGYYYSQAAVTDDDAEYAIKLMKMSPEALKHPQVLFQIAKSQLRLHQTAEAKAMLIDITSQNPDFAPAQELLKTL